ncbi:TIGR03087 family PEP-CTERM/XrtA system glycosyltransferase [Erythrobacter sp. SCSIO 43205]|uniref:TIGR03087 family PEP-CTERM/XrtA system glycosyltransferase n=1 Tax=Erythrobacter sp. SCSIO 43205 TaxID=2779361 RepID=UPI001CA83283|nr:TIGR03087 family PEP-CTERM/XrtA system glycosyltransferase [Erythrobacter sp. SCSIO 43205]UAB77267.1 TIGR03087 family PEP-CTERM/XrtA system glycosyltransferase [Erythrobacter sp. SCSIO 43205]
MGEILFLAHRVPFPPNRGDKIRSSNLLKKLASLAPVHVGCFAENAEDRAGGKEVEAIAASHCVVNRSKPLVLAGAEAVLTGKPVSLTAFHSARLEEWVRHTLATRPITTIFVFSGQMGQYIPDDFAGRVVIDLCDVDSAKFENYAAAGQRVRLNSREGRLLAREEERLAARADATILISDNEAELFRSRLTVPHKTNVQVIGNGIDSDFFDPSRTSPHPELSRRPGPHFVFTGQMDYPPNEQAALWAIESFFALYKSQHTDAELHIVGRNPTKRLQDKAGEGVIIWGEVPDVRPFIAAADSVIVPLSIARGVQNKVLEAMAMARPVLLTSEAATGIDAADGEHWMLCELEPQAMQNRIDAFRANQSAARAMGKAARQFVLDHHNWNAMLAPLEWLVSAGRGDARDAA